MLPRTNRERLVVSMRVSWQSRVRATREKDGQVVRWQVGGRLLETGGRTLKVPVMVRERTLMRVMMLVDSWMVRMPTMRGATARMVPGEW